MKLDKNIIESDFPFLAMIEFADETHIGIVLNKDKHSITFIDFNKIHSSEKLKKIINIGMNWWWYSNRAIPLNLFYYEDVLPYMQHVTSLPAKTSEVLCGHVCSLETLIDRKYYRKNKTLTIINPS